ncbi:MAG: hypothetical protein AAF413_04580, partial [Patescibacteria group bacterium]
FGVFGEVFLVMYTLSLMKKLNLDKISPKNLWSTYKNASKLTKIIASIGLSALLLIAAMYGIATWYKLKYKDVPLHWGFSWSTKYAEEFGVNPIEGLGIAISDLKPDRVRLMSYWDLHEPVRDEYNWTTLDTQVLVATNPGGPKISLAIGLRQPRWPECHWPQWAQDLEPEEWQAELNNYISNVIERYDQYVDEYQLENEFLLGAFGHCPDTDRDRLISEYELVSSLTDKPIVVSRSNNATPTWPVGEPRAEITAMSVYKRAHAVDPVSWIGYFEYPYPSWFYGFLAGANELHTGTRTFIHELQAEPWGPGATVDLSDEEQAKTMDAKRLKKRLEFAENTGIRTIDVWGAEWSYWRKTTRNDDSTWKVFQETFSQN